MGVDPKGFRQNRLPRPEPWPPSVPHTQTHKHAHSLSSATSCQKRETNSKDLPLWCQTGGKNAFSTAVLTLHPLPTQPPTLPPPPTVPEQLLLALPTCRKARVAITGNAKRSLEPRVSNQRVPCQTLYDERGGNQRLARGERCLCARTSSLSGEGLIFATCASCVHVRVQQYRSFWQDLNNVNFIPLLFFRI